MSPSPLDDLHADFAVPHPDCAPMLRWWWFGPSVNRADLDRQLHAMAAAGFGGVEVAYVYPLAEATTTLGSPEFCADLRHAADTAAALGLRFDLTLGSGWSFGGPHITPELAARRLDAERHEIGRDSVRLAPGPVWPGDVLLGAYVGDGSVDASPERWTRLPIVDGNVTVPAGGSPRQVMIVRSRLTGQQVKRAAVGAEGPVLDHYSAAATRAHLAAFGEPLLAAVPGERLGSVFCDSLEVYGADWTPRLPDEFAARHGYDLLDVAPLLFAEGSVGEHDAARVRADYGALLTTLYEENFVAVCADWARDHGVRFRLQGYGTPPALVSSYRRVDGIEGEGWGWDELTQTKWATSASHRFGHSVSSSETWTWVHSPSLRATPLDLQGEAHEHFLLGVNQLVGHGWPYSPADAPGVGWVFYASGALDDRNAWWPAMPTLNTYLSRLSWLLRQGEPVRDIAVHLPSRTLAQRILPVEGGRLDAWHAAKELIGAELPAAIRRGGWDYDALDDACLDGLAPSTYPVVITPAGEQSEAARTWLAAVERSGGTVLRVEGTESADELTMLITARLAPDVVITGGDGQIGVAHRRIGSLDAYLVVNTRPTVHGVELRPRNGIGHAVSWDARTGDATHLAAADDALRVVLNGYQAELIMIDPTPDAARPAAAPPRYVGVGQRVPLTTWTVDGREVTLPHRWEDDPVLRKFCGTVTYRTTVTVSPDTTVVLLDLGTPEPAPDLSARTSGVRGKSYRAELAAPVREVARVRVNGSEVALVWAPPYTVDLSEAIVAGDNEIVVEVSNTSASRLLSPELATLSAEANARDGRRFTLQDVSAATAGLSSGLLAVPELLLGS